MLGYDLVNCRSDNSTVSGLPQNNVSHTCSFPRRFSEMMDLLIRVIFKRWRRNLWYFCQKIQRDEYIPKFNLLLPVNIKLRPGLAFSCFTIWEINSLLDGPHWLQLGCIEWPVCHLLASAREPTAWSARHWVFATNLMIVLIFESHYKFTTRIRVGVIEVPRLGRKDG